CSAGTTAPPGTRYCAYHSAGNAGSGADFIYAVQPYVNGISGCDSGHHPNGSSDSALAGGLSHEHNESITDPYPNTGWADHTNGGAENGDKCGGNYGAALVAPNGSLYNQVVGGHLYYYQQEWSNQGHQCLQGFSFSGAEPTAQFSASPAGGTTMSFDAGGSTAPGGVAQYHWQFENPNTVSDPTVTETETTTATVQHTYSSPGAHTVSLTVYAADGTSIGTSRVIRTGHPALVPSFTTSPTTILTGQPVGFADTTPGSLSSESWNFGDGSPPADGRSPTHTYATTGTFSVTLTVTDELGQTGSVTTPVTVRAPPVLAPGSTVSPGPPASRPPSSSAPRRFHAVLVRVRTRVSRRGRYLLVTVSGAGVLRIGGRSIKVRRAGTVTSTLKLDGRQRGQLRRRHRLVLRLRVVFRPGFGADSARTIKITLRA
ncbi:MAG: PKD domain-containing protein, partial [Actinomycetota bacterium]|nr:PKD domain-containing protein [Actinomycetota bacterium]